MFSLRHLYDELDWSGVDEALVAWEDRHRPQHDPLPDWKERWRCTLLLNALPKGMVPNPAWAEDRMHDARGILAKMGVWPQVGPWLASKGLVTCENPDTAVSCGQTHQGPDFE